MRTAMRKLDFFRLHASWSALLGTRARDQADTAAAGRRNGRIMSMRQAVETPRVASYPALHSGKRIEDVPVGILFMVAATLLFAISSAIAKWQVAIYPVGEVMFMRSFASLVFCATFILPSAGLAVFATRRPRDHIARGLSQSISQTFTVLAFRHMPLARAPAITFSA